MSCVEEGSGLADPHAAEKQSGRLSSGAAPKAPGVLEGDGPRGSSKDPSHVFLEEPTANHANVQSALTNEEAGQAAEECDLDDLAARSSESIGVGWHDQWRAIGGEGEDASIAPAPCFSTVMEETLAVERPATAPEPDNRSRTFADSSRSEGSRNTAHTSDHVQYDSSRRQRPRSHLERSAELENRMRAVIKERSGLSFDERIERANRERSRILRKVEQKQRSSIQAAVRRGSQKSLVLMPDRPPSTASMPERLRRRAREMRVLEEKQRNTILALKERVDNREPLFRLKDVKDAELQLQQRARQRKLELAEQERRELRKLQLLKEKVLERPLLIEYAPPVRQQEAEERKRPPSPPHPLDKTILDAVQASWFKESEWGQKVKEMNAACEAAPRLHELQYPPKHPLKELEPPPNGIALMVERKLNVKLEERRERAAAEDAAQRRKIAELKKAGARMSPIRAFLGRSPE